jgi:hypothetical protein
MLLTDKAQSQRGRAQLLWNSARSTRKLRDCQIKSHRGGAPSEPDELNKDGYTKFAELG